MAKPAAIVPPEVSSAVVGCIHGPPGHGKTTLLGTWGEGMLIIHPPTEHMDPIIGTGVETWKVESWNEMNEVEEFLRHEGDQYDIVTVDNWSLLQDHLLDDVWAWTIDKYPHRKETPIDRGEYNLNFVREQQWLRNVVAIARTGAFHFWFTAHSMDLEDAVSGEMRAQPWIQGKNMASKFQGYTNIIGYLDSTKKGTRVLRFDSGNPDYSAKNQFREHGAFPEDKLIKPTLPKIMEELEAARVRAAAARDTGARKTRKGRSTGRKKTARR